MWDTPPGTAQIREAPSPPLPPATCRTAQAVVSTGAGASSGMATGVTWATASPTAASTACATAAWSSAWLIRPPPAAATAASTICWTCSGDVPSGTLAVTADCTNSAMSSAEGPPCLRRPVCQDLLDGLLYRGGNVLRGCRCGGGFFPTGESHQKKDYARFQIRVHRLRILFTMVGLHTNCCDQVPHMRYVSGLRYEITLP